MQLSDATIRRYLKQGYIKVTPTPEDSAIQSASLELTLGNRFAFPWEPDDEDSYRNVKVNETTYDAITEKQFTERTWTDICIAPNEFMLGHTAETVAIPNDICAQVTGKSTLGRLGLLVHSTAGFIDPGFSGQITLELKNMTKMPIWLRAGQRIAQLVFTLTDRTVERPYGHSGLNSHYQNQVGPTRARDWNGYKEVTLPGL